MPLPHLTPPSNSAVEVLEEAVELGMLAGDAGPLPHTPDYRPLRRGAHADPRKREAKILCRLLAQLGV